MPGHAPVWHRPPVGCHAAPAMLSHVRHPRDGQHQEVSRAPCGFVQTCRFSSCWAHTLMASVSPAEWSGKSSMFQCESTPLFHEHIKAYTIRGISATGECPSYRAVARSGIKETSRTTVSTLSAWYAIS